MRISVFGLGYVGTVTAACLAKQGHQLTGVDPNPVKVEAVNGGRTPVVEPGLGELIQAAVAAGRLQATDAVDMAIGASELSLVCVGTPSDSDGRVDLGHLERCCTGIAAALRRAPKDHTVVIRSTVPPGTMANQVIDWLGAGGSASRSPSVCYNPEFLREGEAISDFERPSKTVVAASDDRGAAVLEALYGWLDTPLVRTDFATAELLKYTENAWHALKVAFANEVGTIGKHLAIDSQALMDAFCLDQKLNLSAAYLRPGFAFGGSCLPKDLRALVHTARALHLDLPILAAVLPSNRSHLERILGRVVDSGVRRIGVLGLSFKEATDDLRESPMVELIERLTGKGYEVSAFDPVVEPQAMIGANRAYALAHLPHIARLMAPTIEAVTRDAELLLIGHIDPTRLPALAAHARDTRILDCAGVGDALRTLPGYEGVCW